MKAIKARILLVIAMLGLVLRPDHSRAQQDIDWDSYHRATEYCRGEMARPLVLRSDGEILCFDGAVNDGLDVSPARNLKENGLFVVRSVGGRPLLAMILADIVRDRHATVVVYDHCFSACAMFFLIASERAYVLKDTLVIWHHPQADDPANPYCPYLVDSARDGLKKLQVGQCRAGGERTAGRWPGLDEFFSKRVIDPLFEVPPDSLHVRRMVRNLYADTGVFRNVPWTIHPRYYPLWFKTRIYYEAYPQSQHEVDQMASRLHLGRVIYDP